LRDDLTKLENLVEELQKKMLTLSDLPKMTRHIGNELVGENYLRWDSQVRCYPTLTFSFFLESEKDFQSRLLGDSGAVQRKVQIKLRVTDFEEIEGSNKSLVEEYEDRCST